MALTVFRASSDVCTNFVTFQHVFGNFNLSHVHDIYSRKSHHHISEKNKDMHT